MKNFNGKHLFTHEQAGKLLIVEFVISNYEIKSDQNVVLIDRPDRPGVGLEPAYGRIRESIHIDGAILSSTLTTPDLLKKRWHK